MGLPRDLLGLLKGRVTLERFACEDTWGNDQFGPPEPGLNAYIEPSTVSLGSQDGNGKQDDRRVVSQRVMTDALRILPKDRLTLPDGRVLNVTEVETGTDEFGNDLYQTITGTTTQRG